MSRPSNVSLSGDRVLFRIMAVALALVACSSGGANSGNAAGAAGSPASAGGAGGQGAISGAPGTGGTTISDGGSGTGATSGSDGFSGSPASAGASSGGAATAGASSGGGGTGGSSGGSAGSGGVAGGGSVGKSAGCGKTPTIAGGANNPITIQSNGARQYLLRVPSNYDSTHPYRLVIAYHESGASAKAVWGYNFYKLWDLANDSTIFVAPDGLNGGWSNTNGNDVAFTDAILAQLEADRCIDTTRIFATGFSFGGAMSIAIACARADVFRGVAFFSGANLSGCQGGTTPIAYYASQASQDHGSLPADSPIAGEVIQAKFAAVNGCTAQDAPIPATGSGKPHICTKYQGCSAGHPVEYCGFDGPHGWQPVDPGQATSWDPPEAWSFITQF